MRFAFRLVIPKTFLILTAFYSLHSQSAFARGQCISSILKLLSTKITVPPSQVPVWSAKDPALYAYGPRPIGMGPFEFQDLLQHFANDPSLTGADVIVLYGSRLHLEAGYPPRPDSDLDISIFYKAQRGRRRIPDADERDVKVNDSLEAMGLPFAPKVDIPRFENFASFLNKEPRTRAADQQQVMHIIDALAREGRWPLSIHRQLYHNVRNKNWFNPEAVFIFKSTNRIHQRVEKLRKLGYKNFILL